MEATGRKTVLVHKEGEEGSILLDYDTGIVTTPIDERPDWADGLAVGQLQERRRFYEQKLGETTAAALLEEVTEAKGIAFQDLSWVGSSETGENTELNADPDYRMDVVAKALGIEREAGDTDVLAVQGAIAEVEIDMQNRYVPSDVELIDEEMSKTFGGQPREAQSETKTGT